jgi:hypothetical protein
LKPTNSPELNEDFRLPCVRPGWAATKSALGAQTFGQ